MKKFEQKVDMRSRKAMTAFLEDHFRYDTANSCNKLTSYANNLKIYCLGLPGDVVDKLFDLMDCEDAYDTINDLIADFGRENGYRYQAGFNGRSGGYLVLYEGGRKQLEYKSVCKKCGQLNYKSVEESGTKCGRCGSDERINLTHPMYQTYVTAKSIDQGEDFELWSIYELKERVKLIQRFDRLCDDIVAEAVFIAENYEAADEEYEVIQTRKVLQEAC